VNPKNDRAPKGAQTPSPRRHFRLEKLEERIAPKGHYNAGTKWVGGSNPPSSNGSIDDSLGGASNY
jgi:hypothetical protein